MKRRLGAIFMTLALVMSLAPGSLAAGRSYREVPIFLGYADVDYMAEEILKEIPTEGKSAREQISEVYDWIIRNCKRNDWDGTTYFDEAEVYAKADELYPGWLEQAQRGEILIRQEYQKQKEDTFEVPYDSTYYIANFASDMMIQRTGNCAHYSALLALLLGHLGFDCRLIDGEFINGSGSRVVHKWNYVLVDGTYYWLDVRMDHANYDRTGKITHTYFMIEDTGEWAKRHAWDSEYSDWLAENADQVAENYTIAATALSDEPWSRCSDWAADYLERAHQGQIFPEILWGENMTADISRQEFAAVAVSLYEALTGETVPRHTGENPFTDTDDPDVLRAYDLGVVKGKGEDWFGPEDFLSREQAVTMLGRVCELVKYGAVADGSGLYQGGVEPFLDDGSIGDYARGYLYFFVELGAVGGMGDGTFAPQRNMSREAAVKVAVETAERFAR